MTERSTARPSGLQAPPQPRTLRLLSIPAHHPYVEAVRPQLIRDVAARRTLGWEPDPIFRPGAIAGVADEVDVVHLHFGFDHLEAVTIRRWLAELIAYDIPLVLTVHDLRNPHHSTRDRHDELLAELIPAATSVLTLTAGAAAEIAIRFGRDAQVAPHPSLIDPAPTAGVRTERGLVVFHLKSIRRNLIDPLAIVEAAAEGAARVGGRLRVDLHPEAVTDSRINGLQQIRGIEIAVHPRFGDLDLERYLRRAHASVLPYRWGTHSGWLELARDLGTRVVVPDCGYYREQWPQALSYVNNETDGLNRSTLSDAVAEALSEPPPAPTERSARIREATDLRDAHEALYHRLVRQ